nr:PREDICTED: uncharacterized protein LOC107075824 isoform X1 [Lepisosteus oculatus]XP_015194119.1 PREDICTED: uncharacterized protein LOC107075824 isoform X2 [Lepisosteus oculatus]
MRPSSAVRGQERPPRLLQMNFLSPSRSSPGGWERRTGPASPPGVRGQAKTREAILCSPERNPAPQRLRTAGADSEFPGFPAPGVRRSGAERSWESPRPCRQPRGQPCVRLLWTAVCPSPVDSRVSVSCGAGHAPGPVDSSVSVSCGQPCVCLLRRWTRLRPCEQPCVRLLRRWTRSRPCGQPCVRLPWTAVCPSPAALDMLEALWTACVRPCGAGHAPGPVDGVCPSPVDSVCPSLRRWTRSRPCGQPCVRLLWTACVRLLWTAVCPSLRRWTRSRLGRGVVCAELGFDCCSSFLFSIWFRLTLYPPRPRERGERGGDEGGGGFVGRPGNAGGL